MEIHREEQYNQEFRKGLDLYEKSFKEIKNAKFEGQKLQYEKVMKESLQVMKDAAGGLIHKHILLAKSQELEEDTATYFSHQDPKMAEKIEKDLRDLRSQS